MPSINCAEVIKHAEAAVNKYESQMKITSGQAPVMFQRIGAGKPEIQQKYNKLVDEFRKGDWMLTDKGVSSLTTRIREMESELFKPGVDDNLINAIINDLDHIKRVCSKLASEKEVAQGGRNIKDNVEMIKDLFAGKVESYKVERDHTKKERVMPPLSQKTAVKGAIGDAGIKQLAERQKQQREWEKEGGALEIAKGKLKHVTTVEKHRMPTRGDIQAEKEEMLREKHGRLKQVETKERHYMPTKEEILRDKEAISKLKTQLEGAQGIHFDMQEKIAKNRDKLGKGLDILLETLQVVDDKKGVATCNRMIKSKDKGDYITVAKEFLNLPAKDRAVVERSFAGTSLVADLKSLNAAEETIERLERGLSELTFLEEVGTEPEVVTRVPTRGKEAFIRAEGREKGKAMMPEWRQGVSEDLSFSEAVASARKEARDKILTFVNRDLSVIAQQNKSLSKIVNDDINKIKTLVHQFKFKEAEQAVLKALSNARDAGASIPDAFGRGVGELQGAVRGLKRSEREFLKTSKGLAEAHEERVTERLATLAKEREERRPTPVFRVSTAGFEGAVAADQAKHAKKVMEPLFRGFEKLAEDLELFEAPAMIDIQGGLDPDRDLFADLKGKLLNATPKEVKAAGEAVLKYIEDKLEKAKLLQTQTHEKLTDLGEAVIEAFEDAKAALKQQRLPTGQIGREAAMADILRGGAERSDWKKQLKMKEYEEKLGPTVEKKAEQYRKEYTLEPTTRKERGEDVAARGRNLAAKRDLEVGHKLVAEKQNQLKSLLSQELAKFDKRDFLGAEGKRLDTIQEHLNNNMIETAVEGYKSFVEDHKRRDSDQGVKQMDQLADDISKLNAKMMAAQEIADEWKQHRQLPTERGAVTEQQRKQRAGMEAGEARIYGEKKKLEAEKAKFGEEVEVELKKISGERAELAKKMEALKADIKKVPGAMAKMDASQAAFKAKEEARQKAEKQLTEMAHLFDAVKVHEKELLSSPGIRGPFGRLAFTASDMEKYQRLQNNLLGAKTPDEVEKHGKAIVKMIGDKLVQQGVATNVGGKYDISTEQFVENPHLKDLLNAVDSSQDVFGML